MVIRIVSLQTAEDNAILDPDDSISDVLDDKDLVSAPCDMIQRTMTLLREESENEE